MTYFIENGRRYRTDKLTLINKTYNNIRSYLTVGRGWRDGIGTCGDRVLLRIRGRGGAPSAVVSSTRAWIVLAPYTACRACLAHFPGVV